VRASRCRERPAFRSARPLVRATADLARDNELASAPAPAATMSLVRADVHAKREFGVAAVLVVMAAAQRDHNDARPGNGIGERSVMTINVDHGLQRRLPLDRDGDRDRVSRAAGVGGVGVGEAAAGAAAG
jgi:hypothetical protein